MSEPLIVADRTSTKAWHTMLKIILTIIVAEAAIMVLFETLPLPELKLYELAALDAVLLGITIAPALYFFLLLPMQRHAIGEQKARFIMFDSLTGLPRRELFRELAEQEISKARRESGCVAMIVIDPSNTSGINQSFGYKIGDQLLSQLAARVRSTLRESDIVSRLGGDEFAVLLPHTDVRLVNGVVAKINAALDEPFEIDDIYIDIVNVMGVSIFPDHAETAGDLIQRANIALNKAKQEKVSCAVYNILDESDSRQRLVIFGQLRKVIKEKGLELYYQPKISLHNEEISGVEALVRWNGEHGQFPDFFIPLAEQTGLIDEITRWVFIEAVDQCAQWREKGFTIPVSINVSPRNLYNSNLIDFFIQYVEGKPLPYPMVTIEVTESAIMRNPELAIKLLSKLARYGFKVSIDDFGTGYSSLTYLKLLPATELKIDQSFIANILSDKKDGILVKSTIALARDLGLQVVVEGVETEEMLEKLRTYGPDIAQGYHYSRPLNSDAYIEWHQQWGLSKGHISCI